MNAEKKPNIFDTAAKKMARRKVVEEKQKESDTRWTPHTLTPQHRDPEIREMLQKIEVMKEDLRVKIEDIHKRSGLSYEQIQAFMENPKNFSKAEWAKLQDTKDKLGEEVWTAIGKELKPEPRKRENIAGERKGKTLGARKKWIPMS